MSDVDVKKKILKRMIDREMTQTEIARKYGVSVAVINQVIAGKRQSKRLRRAIAKELGLRPSDIWRRN